MIKQLKQGAETLRDWHGKFASSKEARNWRNFAALAVLAAIFASFAVELSDKGNGQKHSVIRVPATVALMDGDTQKGEFTFTEGMEVDIIDIDPVKDMVLIRTPNKAFEGWVDKTAITGVITEEVDGPKVRDVEKQTWEDPTIQHFPIVKTAATEGNKGVTLPGWWIPHTSDNAKSYEEAKTKPWKNTGPRPFPGSGVSMVLLKQGETQSYVRSIPRTGGGIIQPSVGWEGWLDNTTLVLGDKLENPPVYNGPIPNPGEAPVPPPEGWKVRALTARQGVIEKLPQWEGDYKGPSREFWAKGDNVLQILIKEGVAAAYERKGAELKVARSGGEKAGKLAGNITSPPVTVDELTAIYTKEVKPIAEENGIQSNIIAFSDATDWDKKGVNSLKSLLLDFRREVKGFAKYDTTALAVVAKSNWNKTGTMFDEDKLSTQKLETVLLSSYDAKTDTFVCRRFDSLKGWQSGLLRASELKEKGVAFMVWSFDLQ